MAGGIAGIGSGVNSSAPSIFEDPNVVAQLQAPPVNGNINDTSGTSAGPETTYEPGREVGNCQDRELYRRRGVSDSVCTPNGSSSSDSTGGAANSGTPANENSSGSSTLQGPTGTTPNAVAPPTSSPTQTTSTLQGRDPDLIHAGEKIKLPDGSTYTVKDGDTLSGIAKAHGASLASLIKLNGFNEQLLDEYKDGKLIKAHHVGDPMPTTPGGAAAVPGTPQVSPTASTTTTPDPANSSSSSSNGVNPQSTGVVNPDQANSAGTSPKELLKNIDRITNAEDRQTLKNLLEILVKHDADPSAPLFTADQTVQWKELGDKYGANFGLADASSASGAAPEPTPPGPATTVPSDSGSAGSNQPLMG